MFKLWGRHMDFLLSMCIYRWCMNVGIFVCLCACLPEEEVPVVRRSKAEHTHTSGKALADNFLWSLVFSYPQKRLPYTVSLICKLYYPGCWHGYMKALAGRHGDEWEHQKKTIMWLTNPWNIEFNLHGNPKSSHSPCCLPVECVRVNEATIHSIYYLWTF